MYHIRTDFRYQSAPADGSERTAAGFEVQDDVDASQCASDSAVSYAWWSYRDGRQFIR